MKVLYTATATAIGGRQGRVRSDDGVLDTPLAHPKELGGPGGARPTPSSSSRPAMQPVENALLRVARERKALILDSSVTAQVGLGREADGYFRLTVALEVSVPGRDRAEIEEFARIAHEEVCPYS